MSRRERGRETEKLLAKYLVLHGFETAHVTSMAASGSDILGIDGLDIEVKARKGFDPSAAMAQLKKRLEKGGAGMGIAVLRLNGQGEAALDDWVGVIRLSDLVYLLKASGYGR
jgi:Holliday junction resolvase